MNMERMLEVQKQFKEWEPNDRFDFTMASVYTHTPCGTAGCIAGFVNYKMLGNTHGASKVIRWLELTEQQAEDLFFPDRNYLKRAGVPTDYDLITKKDAEKLIDYFIENNR